MQQLSCPICSGDSYRYYEYKDFFGDLVGIYKCINCGHGSHDRLYMAERLSEIYQADYAADYLAKERELCQQRQVQYVLDVELLLQCRQYGAISVLDYGCSSGGYLDAMPSTWEKSGFEVNPFHIEYLRDKKNHIKVFDNILSIEGQFDLITLRGVIEHIPDHAELIALLNKHLSPGGSVFVTATPDFSSVCATLYKSRWNQVVCPEHIHQFTPASLSILLARAGLALRSLHHPYIGTPYENWPEDKAKFLDNLVDIKNNSGLGVDAIHAFSGNMISGFYER